VAPTAESPYRTQQQQHRHHAILPYSLYKRRLEQQQNLSSTAQHEHASSSATSTERSDQPVYLYLPAFKNANRSQIADEADALQR
jgi:hypothetical protein